MCGLMCTWIHESDAELICMRFLFVCLFGFCFVFFSDVLTYCVMLQAFIYAIVLSSDVFDARAHVCVVHWHCTAQLSMFNMEKRFRNKIIIIIMFTTCVLTNHTFHFSLNKPKLFPLNQSVIGLFLYYMYCQKL